MTAKFTTLDQIEITKDGLVCARLEKTPGQWHRTAFYPGIDIDAQIAAVNADLARMEENAVNPDDVQRIKEHAKIAWTDSVISAYQERLKSAELKKI